MAKTFPPDLRALRYIWNWTPILMFHEVLPDYTPNLPPYAITRSGLRNILVDFIERGYSGGSLDDVMPSATMGVLPRPRAKKRMVLTFDDGTRDFVDNALPVLQELDITATLFIVAGKVGGRRDWDPLHGDPL
ncbi:MAG TPA: polysaccharide deacetylase family protein, partial [Chloroflexia bacterium]|nr:polysaccharide deacetylase family protein [Chloroflexia bacterium]